jgi:hypothetical protein
MKKFSQDSQSQLRDLNPGSPEYEATVPNTQSRQSEAIQTTNNYSVMLSFITIALHVMLCVMVQKQFVVKLTIAYQGSHL